LKKRTLSYEIIGAAALVVAIPTILALNSPLFVLNYHAQALSLADNAMNFLDAAHGYAIQSSLVGRITELSDKDFVVVIAVVICLFYHLSPKARPRENRVLPSVC
jgi:hypothetical protein